MRHRVSPQGASSLAEGVPLGITMTHINGEVAMKLWQFVLCLTLFAPGVRAEDTPAPPNPEAVAAIKALGGNVMAIAQNDPRLDVTLHLADKDVTDDALVSVAKLTNVLWLNLARTKITDGGLAAIKDMKTLERLHLEKTSIGDAGLEHLKGLENLTYLNLYATQVTDAGLVQLHGLKKLKRLFLFETKVTQEGIAALKTAMPELQVIAGIENKPAEPPKPAEEPKPAPAEPAK